MQLDDGSFRTLFSPPSLVHMSPSHSHFHQYTLVSKRLYFSIFWVTFILLLLLTLALLEVPADSSYMVSMSGVKRVSVDIKKPHKIKSPRGEGA